MNIQRSDISTTDNGEIAEARIELPYPMQTENGDTVMFGHGETKLAAKRALLREIRSEFPSVEITD